MKLYEVSYRPNSYSEPQTVRIVAGSVTKAVDAIKNRRYAGYSKTVVTVQEKFDVFVAK